MKLSQAKVAIIGLGYVGLPLAIEFSKKIKIIGFDINKQRINELNKNYDRTLEISSKNIKLAKKIKFTHDENELKSCNCYIVTVPTPVDKYKQPNLVPLISATKLIAKYIKKKNIVIYESTVFPGCTEEVCVPVLEKHSKLKLNKDFFCGYSPERINPGDKKRRISDINKIISGSTPETLKFIGKLYKQIIKVKIHRAPNIKVAEAAKVIENIQRDLNIALINELFLLFNRLQINTKDVLDAAQTKWNFLPFKPGLVGGHCIGVDPYYLTHKASSIGHYSEIILAGRRINDEMPNYLTSKIIEVLNKKSILIMNTKILIMGLTFKENCPDLRNSGIKKVFDNLNSAGCNLDLHDPLADKNEVEKIYKKTPIDKIIPNNYDAILVLVGHSQYKKIKLETLIKYCKTNSLIYDLKNIYSNENFINIQKRKS